MNDIGRIFASLSLAAICTGCALKDTTPASSKFGDAKGGGSRNMYSPEIYGDAYAQQQWIAGIEALEAQCRTDGKYCLEAHNARQSLGNDTGRFTSPTR